MEANTWNITCVVISVGVNIDDALCLQEGHYDIGGDERFDTLTDLVEHYREHPVTDMSGSVIKLDAVSGQPMM